MTMPLTPPVLGSRSTIVLTYPYVSPTNTLELRNPEFQNPDTMDIQNVLTRSRGGDLILIRDPLWPVVETKSYKIVTITAVKKELFKTFLQESRGKEIGLLDYENRQWHGIILNPNARIVTIKDTCSYDITFDFEGSLA